MQPQSLEKIEEKTILNTDLSMLASLQTFDAHLLEIIRQALVIHAPWFETLILIFADSEPIIFSVFLLGLWFYGISLKNNGPKHVALDLFWHVFAAFFIYWIVNHLLPIRPRPESFSSLPPLIDHLPDNSFPSGHAMFWGASWWALHILLNRPRVTLTFFILGFITCLTRVIAGIHYPGDIVVGFLLGWLIVAILLRMPHGAKYREYAQNLPLRLARYLSL